jgi:ZIP family zinc transporter
MNTAARRSPELLQDSHGAARLKMAATSLALVLGVGLVVWVAWANGGADLSSPMGKALTGGLAAALATALGALPAILVRHLSTRLEDVMLGFGAGVMVAASCFSLILPGVDAAATMFGARMAGSAWVASGFVLGALFLLAADKVVPHAHPVAGRHGPDVVHLRRVWLMVFAIVLHNIPEGMAIGVGFGGNDPSVGMPLTAAIAIQDVPEGLVVAIALRTVAYRPVTAALIGAASGLVEPVGAILGNVLTTGFAMLYPLGLGFAAGAMIWVVSHEIIPETHRKGHEQAATLGLIGGFVVMMMLDTALG